MERRESNELVGFQIECRQAPEAHNRKIPDLTFVVSPGLLCREFSWQKWLDQPCFVQFPKATSTRKHRTMRAIKETICITVIVLGLGVSARAGMITLYDTGVNAGGTSLPDGTIGDSHYSLTSVPGGTTDIRVRTSAGGYPIPPYIGDSPTSAWIGPNNDLQVDGPIGNYTYQTTFNLTGLNPSTASITGQWSSDNNGVKILLNGADTGNPGTSFTQFSSGYAPFNISSGFVPGLNVLDFVVENGGGPTALRVEMTGSASSSSSSVPDDSTTPLLMGLAASGLAAARRITNHRARSRTLLRAHASD
jgi:hypothetical protein